MSTPFTISADDSAIRAALQRLVEKAENPNPVLQAIGEASVERIKHRFDTSTDPEGQPWKPNSAATLAAVAARIGQAKSNRKKDGDLNARGERALANKKPLIRNGDLRRQIVAVASGGTLSVFSTMVYAATQQFGAKSGQFGFGLYKTRNGSFPLPWGDIPSRRFMPIRQDGTVDASEQAAIMKDLNDWLAEGLSQ